MLKLVGATDAFVRKPFVIEGSVQGALGAAGALALLALLFLVVRGRLDEELAALVGVEPSFLALAGRRSGWCSSAPRSGRPRRSRACASWSRYEARVDRRASRRRRSLAAVALGHAAAPTEPRASLGPGARARRARSQDRRSRRRRAVRQGRDRAGRRAGRRRACARPRARQGVLQAHARGAAARRRRLRLARDVRHARRADAAAARAATSTKRLGCARARSTWPPRLERIARDRVAFASQRTAMDAARLAMLDESRRQAAFDRAFQTSTGASADYVAVYGGAGDLGYDAPTEGFAAARGRLVFPVAGRADVRARAHARAPTDPGSRSTRPPGPPCAPSFAGHVAFADRYGPYGRIVILDHGAHYYTVSGNLDEIDVKIGQDVGAGERIGTVGDDGPGTDAVLRGPPRLAGRVARRLARALGDPRPCRPRPCRRRPSLRRRSGDSAYPWRPRGSRSRGSRWARCPAGAASSSRSRRRS